MSTTTWTPRCICGPDITGEDIDEHPDCPIHGLEPLRLLLQAPPAPTAELSDLEEIW